MDNNELFGFAKEAVLGAANELITSREELKNADLEVNKDIKLKADKASEKILMNKLNAVLDQLEKKFQPVSIFLYGSRARTDFLEKSDYEIGILFRSDKYISRSEIKKAINKKGFNIYPFRYEDFIKRKIDTPFQSSIYLYELIKSGKTLRGREVIEGMSPSPIKVIDLMQDIRFNIGFALASIISHRNGDSKTASMEFYKSCLFGARDLIILTKKKFAFSYDDIFKFSKKIDLDEYVDLVSVAYGSRIGKSSYENDHLFKNISFLNKFIEPQITQIFEKKGNIELIA